MNALWQQLAAEGLVTGEAPPAVAPRGAWYVSVMLGFAAWVAALLLTLVIVLVFNGRNAIGVSGAVACAVGLALLRLENPFLTQLGLAASLAGQAGLFLGLAGVLEGYRQPAALLAVILIGPSLFTRNAFYRAWCTAAAVLLLALSLDAWGAVTVGLAAALVTLVFLVMPQIPRAYGYGAAVALVVVDGLNLFGRHASLSAGTVGSVLAGAALVYACARLFHRVVPAVLIAVLLIPAPGVAAALLLVVLGFGCAAPVLLGLGVAAGLAYLGNYYYALSLTLLMKSLVLVASGVVLLALRWFFFRQEAA